MGAAEVSAVGWEAARRVGLEVPSSQLRARARRPRSRRGLVRVLPLPRALPVLMTM